MRMTPISNKMMSAIRKKTNAPPPRDEVSASCPKALYPLRDNGALLDEIFLPSLDKKLDIALSSDDDVGLLFALQIKK